MLIFPVIWEFLGIHGNRPRIGALDDSQSAWIYLDVIVVRDIRVVSCCNPDLIVGIVFICEFAYIRILSYDSAFRKVYQVMIISLQQTTDNLTACFVFDAGDLNACELDLIARVLQLVALTCEDNRTLEHRQLTVCRRYLIVAYYFRVFGSRCYRLTVHGCNHVGSRSSFDIGNLAVTGHCHSEHMRINLGIIDWIFEICHIEYSIKSTLGQLRTVVHFGLALRCQGDFTRINGQSFILYNQPFQIVMRIGYFELVCFCLQSKFITVICFRIADILLGNCKAILIRSIKSNCCFCQFIILIINNFYIIPFYGIILTRIRLG